MSKLAQVRARARPAAPIMTVYGPGGIGKTTFAASAPSPIVIRTEDGIGRLSVAHSEQVERTYADIAAWIGDLLSGEHEYQTVVLDSLDHLEPIVWAETSARHGKPDIEAFGYGKGYLAALDVWRELLDGFRALRDRGMAVVLIAHSEIKTFNSPETEPYDRYGIKLHKGAAALVIEASDIVGFANTRTVVTRTESGFNKEIRRGVTTGERLLHLVEKPAYVAKNRYALPDSIPLSWDAFTAAMAASFQS